MHYKKVLIVEDQQAICDLYRAELHMLPCELVFTESIDEAAAVMKNSSIDLLISNYRPHKGEAYLDMFDLAAKYAIPYIVVTSYPIQLPSDKIGYIHKQPDMNALKRRMNDLLVRGV